MPETIQAPRRAVALGLALAFVALSVAIPFAVGGLASSFAAHSATREIVAGILSLAWVLAMTAWARRRWPWAERAGLRIFPGARSGRAAAFGAAMGTTLFAVLYSLVRATGGIEVAWRGAGSGVVASTVVLGLATTALAVAWEEFAVRGWAFAACVAVLGPHPTALGFGVLFGLLHFLNPLWSAGGILSVTLAGLLLSYSLLASRSLLLVIGLHLGWNATQWLLVSERFWTLQKDPNALLSGGEWGLEASAIGILVTLSAAALAFALYSRKAPRLRRTPEESSL